MKKLILTLFVFILSLTSWAYIVDGISYTVYDNQDKKTATVTYNVTTITGSSTTYSSNYSGDIKIPETIIVNGTTYTVTAIGDIAFKGCSGLTSITIPKSVTSIGNEAFFGCDNLKKVNITSLDAWCNIHYTSLYSQPLYYAKHLYYNGNEVTDLIIPSSVNRIESLAFYGCSSLTSVSIPNSVSKIGTMAFDGCIGLTSVSIGNFVTSIDNSAFSNCPSITSVNITDLAAWCKITFASDTSNPLYYARHLYLNGEEVTDLAIPSSITSFSKHAFKNCIGLTSINIPNSVISFDDSSFYGCSNINSVTLNSNAITSKTYTSSSNLSNIFGSQVTEYIFGDSVTSIGSYACYNCNNLKRAIIGNSVSSIEDYAFRGCTGLTSITFPNTITSIGQNAFNKCSSLTSITIPSSVTSIENYAFSYCNNLKKVNIKDIAAWCKITFNSDNSNPLYYAKHLFLNDKEITSLEIPNTVYIIKDYAFFNCEGLKSVIIADSVVWICDKAFYGCIGLNSVSVGNNVTSIGEYAFYNCTNLKNTTIGKSVNNIGNYAFQGCTNLSKVTINSNELCSKNYSENNSLQQVFTSAKEYILGEDVNSIGEYALAGTKMEKLTILNPMVTFNENAMKNCTNLRNVYTNRGGTTLLYLWNLGLNTYDVRTFTLIEHPDISFQLTQTTATASVSNYYDEYKYEAYFKKNPNDYYYQEDRPESIEMTDKNYKIKGLKPGAEYNYWMYIKQGDVSYLVNGTYSPTSINPQVDILKKTPTSLHLQGKYTHGDAVFKDQRISFSYNEAENSNIIVKDKLNPNTNYRVKYEVDVLWGENNENTATYKWEDDISTDWVWFDVLEPKVVSVGNVIVASNVNIDDDDAVVGFEWRRMDWPDEISSSTGGAVLYEGTMEGIIRNMNTNYLWKVRPYFKSFDGWDTYYGDWVGFDPSNTSYFQPTVHTYSKVVVNGNTASLKGYAMRGTDNVTSQGFKYWRTTNASSSLKDIDIPSNAQTVTASGQIMTATLTNLEYATNYICVAFVETSEGETFYGEPQTFRTANVTGIEQIQINPDATHTTDNNTSESVRTIVGYYNLQGQRITQPQKGIVIVRYSDGTSSKMLVK